MLRRDRLHPSNIPQEERSPWSSGNRTRRSSLCSTTQSRRLMILYSPFIVASRSGGP